MTKHCCKEVINDSVHWNPFNKVVQCHNCGHVWLPKRSKCKGDIAVKFYDDTKQVQCMTCGMEWRPASKLEYFLNRFFKWW